jgi:hypothetical protein
LLSLVLFLLILFPAVTSAAEPIDRQFESLRLGMTPQDFQKAFSSQEHNDLYLNLLPGERVFAVTETALPKGMMGLTGRFFHDRLYKISVEYTRDGFSEEAWNAMVSRQMERYGRVPVQQQPIGERINEIIRWEDDATVFILQRELRIRFQEKKMVKSFSVLITYLDKAIWEERLKAEAEFLF